MKAQYLKELAALGQQLSQAPAIGLKVSIQPALRDALVGLIRRIVEKSAPR